MKMTEKALENYLLKAEDCEAVLIKKDRSKIDDYLTEDQKRKLAECKRAFLEGKISSGM